VKVVVSAQTTTEAATSVSSGYSTHRVVLRTQVAGNEAHASAMVLHMLQGLRHIGKKQVLVRNVKPDNVLVEHVVGLGSSKRERFIPRFSDFGLSVDVSAGGHNLRKPVDGAKGTELVGQLVGWWYDTQKVSPRSFFPPSSSTEAPRKQLSQRLSVPTREYDGPRRIRNTSSRLEKDWCGEEDEAPDQTWSGASYLLPSFAVLLNQATWSPAVREAYLQTYTGVCAVWWPRASQSPLNALRWRRARRHKHRRCPSQSGSIARRRSARSRGCQRAARARTTCTCLASSFALWRLGSTFRTWTALQSNKRRSSASR
jgi:serine/threonine protein kinase